MSWVAVKSSQLHSFKHDPVENTLDARFVCQTCGSSGKTGADTCRRCKGQGWSGHYQYSGVPTAVYTEVRDSDSVGSAFNRLIKKGEHVKPAHPFQFKKVA